MGTNYVPRHPVAAEEDIEEAAVVVEATAGAAAALNPLAREFRPKARREIHYVPEALGKRG